MRTCAARCVRAVVTVAGGHRRTPLLPTLLLLVGFVAMRCALAQTQESTATQADFGTVIGSLKLMSLEQLANVQVTSVSKTGQPLSDAAAAIYVISHDDIVRSGATSLPEVLRLAPNLQVFQTSPSNYVITARGFSGNSADQNFSDKLLVLIDGRTVYSPLYSGIYWDAQNPPLDDIDRIEIISGPGATLWGANAVNGVINIITRRSSQTPGAEVSVGGGNLQKSVDAQYGGAINPSATYRVYIQAFQDDSFGSAQGIRADDGWYNAQAGFRSDWSTAADAITLQGDTYRGNENSPDASDVALAGSNLLARWQHPFSPSANLQLQAYYDQSQRFTENGGAFVLNTYDLELQNSLLLAGIHSIVWGADERISRYGITNTPTLLFIPESRTLNLSDVFTQDTIAITPQVAAIVGIKLEDDPYTGTTALPNVRLSWKPSDGALLWSAVSRAIRSATPFDRDVVEYLSGTRFLVGGPDFRSEKLTAYELGYRGEFSSTWTLSISTFFNSYDDLRSIEFAPNGQILPLQWGNDMRGTTYGSEIWGKYQALSWWRLAFGWSELREDLSFRPGSSGLLGTAQAGDDPEHQASLRSSMDFGRVAFDADLRTVSPLPDPAVPGYTELNARIAWHASRIWDIALSGANLLHPHHQEFTVPPSDLIGRSVLLSATLRVR
jgi:iron complex outermembrane recepter protein